jgi:hypothetical protein
MPVFGARRAAQGAKLAVFRVRFRSAQKPLARTHPGQVGGQWQEQRGDGRECTREGVKRHFLDGRFFSAPLIPSRIDVLSRAEPPGGVLVTLPRRCASASRYSVSFSSPTAW